MAARVSAGRSRQGSRRGSGSGGAHRSPPSANAFSVRNAVAAVSSRDTIERLWRSMPKQAFAFLLETPLDSLTLDRFVGFWSSPALAEYTRNKGVIERLRDASYTMSYNYLTLGLQGPARALMLNGSFLFECMDTPIESIASTSVVRLFRHAETVKTPQAAKSFVRRMLRMFGDSSKKAVIDHVCQTGDGRAVSGHQKSSMKPSEEKQIQLILEDENSNAEKRHVLNIGSSTTLKTLFNDYAEKLSVSLRSLRFSHRGGTLFLSSIGNRTPDELNMVDQDVIIVCNMKESQEQNNTIPKKKKKKKQTSKQAKKHSSGTKKRKGKIKKIQRTVDVRDTSPEDECQAQHSKLLSKLHEEVQPRLKEIRTRLNALDLERQPPKEKQKNKKKQKAVKIVERKMSLPHSGVGGKAGKPHFAVHVGEVRHLYKTTKSQRKRQRNVPTLDLHGCTRDEALAKLDESLAAWVDAAMRGAYPFVMPAKIVCGCGGQVLSETVEKWIRERDQVANSPKALS